MSRWTEGFQCLGKSPPHSSLDYVQAHGVLEGGSPAALGQGQAWVFSDTSMASAASVPATAFLIHPFRSSATW